MGIMKLPLSDADIDEKACIRLIRYAIDNGVNYLDIDYPYIPERYKNILKIIGSALEGGYRRKVRLSINLPAMVIKSLPDFDCYLNKQLELLQIDRTDHFLLGGMNRQTWPQLRELGIIHFIERAMASQRIGLPGFSFHDDFQTLKEVVTGYNWAFCSFPYNYMEVDRLPGVFGLKYAADKGLGVVVTEPLKRGRLIKDPPQSVAKCWEEVVQKRSLSEWGLRWAWDQSFVSTVICDMSSVEEIEQNLWLADQVIPNSLSVEEELMFNRVRDAYRRFKPLKCTTCRACMPCPQDIDVPRIFELYSDGLMYDDAETARAILHFEQHQIEACNGCGVCARRCGKGIDIPEILKTVQRM